MAETVAAVFFETTLVATVNATDFAPIGIVTVNGATTDIDVEANLTAMALLPAPAVSLSVTLPDMLVPPTVVVGLRVKAVIVNGLTVRVAVCVTPPNVALMIGCEIAATFR